MMKNKTKTYQVMMLRTATDSSINFQVIAQDAFKAIKLAEELLSGWVPVKVNRGTISERQNHEEE